MQIIVYCFVQIKVPPPLANDLNQLIYSSFAPHRPGDFDPCLAPPRPVPKILTLKRFINAGIVIGVENVLPKPLSWRCTNFATVGRSHFYKKMWVLWEIVSKTNFPDDSHVLLTQEKRLTNSGLWYLWKIFYKNHCNDDAQISPHWGEAIFRRRIESFVKNCSQNQSPRWVTCLLTQEKSLTNAVIVISVENIYKTAVLKTHKFCHSGAKPFLEGKLWVLWANVFYTNIPDESHVNSHRRKVLQTQKCDICGKYISKPLASRCTNIATVGRRHF